MSVRYRTVKKVGNGKYVTTSWKISDLIIINILYYIMVFPFIVMIKYCLYVPIKWIISKIIDLIKNNKNEKNEY